MKMKMKMTPKPKKLLEEFVAIHYFVNQNNKWQIIILTANFLNSGIELELELGFNLITAINSHK